MPLESDDELRHLLQGLRSVAVLGIKAAEAEDAFKVPAYLQRQGLRILPVSPKLDRVLEEPCVPDLASLEQTPDLIDVFRAAAHLPAHTEEILALPARPRAVWFQLGIREDACAARLEAAGIEVVQDRCLMVEWARLLGGASPAH